MMTAVIEVTGLTKRYGDQTVVDDIAFHVDAGEIFGILGPNGAGKTTAVECTEGLRRRDGGEVRILGLDPLTDRHRLHQRIGVQHIYAKLGVNDRAAAVAAGFERGLLPRP
jgi:ABC-2 type transport system ATP-binding protein